MIDVIGYAAGHLGIITLLPQLIKTMCTRKAAYISMAITGNGGVSPQLSLAPACLT
jgi:uncharacterized protein with PQ loop repeat